MRRHYVTLALRLLLSVVFLYSAWAKLRQPWALLAMAIDAYQLVPLWFAELAARALPWAELALGLLLISGRWLRLSASASSLVLLCFLSVMVRAYVRGMQIECGCFGEGDIISPYTLARDGSLLVASLLLTVVAFWRSRPIERP